MPDFSELIIKLKGDSSSLDKEFKKSQRILEDFGNQITSIGTRLTAAVTIPIIGIGTAALQAAGKMEQTNIAFKTMLGSSTAAEKHLKELKDFALATPFEFEDLTAASKKMQALGFSAREVLPTLRIIGDAASGLGMGAEGINRITLALGQMKAKGVVSAEEMRQLAEAGIPAWQILAKTLNTDVAGAMKLVEKRAVDSATAVPALLAGMNSKFGGMMQAQSETMLGQWSNFKDKMTFTLAEIGTALMPVAKDMISFMTSLGERAKSAAEGFAALPAPIRATGEALAAVAIVAGPLMLVLGQVAGAVKNLRDVWALTAGLRAGITAAGSAIGAAGAGAAGVGLGAMWLWDKAKATKSYQETLKHLSDEQDKHAQSVGRMTQAHSNANAAFMANVFSTQSVTKETTAATTAQVKLNTEKAKAVPIFEYLALKENETAKAALDSYIAHSKLHPVMDLVAIQGKAAGDSIAVLKLKADYAVSSITKMISPSETLTEVMGLMSDKVLTADQAFEVLGIKSQKVLDATQRRLKQAYDTLVDLYYLGSKDVDGAALNRAADAVRKGQVKTDSVSIAKSAQADKTRQPLIQISTIITDFSRGITDMLFQAKSFGQVLTDIGKQVSQSLVRGLIETGVSKAVGALGKFVGNLGGVGKVLGSIFGNVGGSVAGSVAGNVAGSTIGSTVGSTVGSAAGSAAGGAASGAAGAASSGLAAAVNMVTGAVTAVASVVQAFQLHGIGKDTGRMEESLRGILNVLALNGSESIHQFTKATMFYTGGLRDYWTTVGHSLLVQISSNLDVLAANSKLQMAGGVTINFQGGIFLADASDMDKLADELARRIKERAGFR
jgi:tape measure domain-containing protein